MKFLFFSAALFILAQACNPSTPEETNTTPPKTDETPLAQEQGNPDEKEEKKIPYHVQSADDVMELGEGLLEISGLAYHPKTSTFVAVHDEYGKIYTLNLQTKTSSEKEWRKNGDYEGVEIVDGVLWIVKNTGTIYKTEEWTTSETPEIKKFKSFLDDSFDVEGLGYDKETHSLLLACKANGTLEKNQRPIYRFDLKTETIIEEPLFILNVDTVIAFMKSQGKHDKYLREYLEEKQGEKLKFGPSGIAVHPETGHFYITSAKGNTLLITDRKGNLLEMEKLVKPLHTQPEGIAFDPEGNLYISNEGSEEAPAKVLKFIRK